MLSVLKYGGFKTAGELRREGAARKFEPVDLFTHTSSGMDAFARGLKIAAAMARKTVVGKMKQRYASWDSGIGAKIRIWESHSKNSKLTMLQKGDADANASGRRNSWRISSTSSSEL